MIKSVLAILFLSQVVSAQQANFTIYGDIDRGLNSPQARHLSIQGSAYTLSMRCFNDVSDSSNSSAVLAMTDNNSFDRLEAQFKTINHCKMVQTYIRAHSYSISSSSPLVVTLNAGVVERIVHLKTGALGYLTPNFLKTNYVVYSSDY